MAARTLPGMDPNAAYFTRGSGHTKTGAYTEIPDEYQEVVDRLARKHKASAKFVPEPVVVKRAGARIGIVTLGGCDLTVRESLNLLAERGIEAS
jgi:2-oxoglutarate ferredoxin oxidoreductase subunit alpha